MQLDENALDSHYVAEVHFGAVDLEGFEEGSTEIFRVSTASCILVLGGSNSVIAVGFCRQAWSCMLARALLLCKAARSSLVQMILSHAMCKVIALQQAKWLVSERCSVNVSPMKR